MPRRPAALSLVVLLVAVPFAGCADLANAGGDGFGETWPLQLVEVDLLHERGLTGEGVTVAVIDTGIDVSHPEFKGVSVRWADLVNGRQEAYDDHGHGTHVAAIIAAQGTWNTVFSGFRLKGAAPGVDLIIIKAMDAEGNGDETRVAKGINSAVNAGADVIVLSLGGKTRAIFGTNTENAVRNAVDKGIFVVAAAGNLDKKGGETSCTITSPASVEGVIAVGAVDSRKAIADFSCKGTGKEGSGSIAPGVPSPVSNSRDPHKKPEVVAPGVEILSAWDESGYASASGTSQAAPFVGAILALVLEGHPELQQRDRDTVYDVKAKLMATSEKVGPLAGSSSPSAHDVAYGYGLIRADALYRALA